MPRHPLPAVALCLALTVVCASRLAAEIPAGSPESAGMRAERLEGIAELVEQGLAEKRMPGCVICVGRRGKVVYHEAFGLKQVTPERQPMTVETLFDMASLTKPVATATSVMMLLEDGRFRLDDRATKFLPEFAPHDKDDITIRQMLVHQSGLIPDNPLRDYLDGPQTAWEKLCQLELTGPVGERFRYSDVNFIVLAKLVERVAGKDVHAFSQQRLFRPLGMTETGYQPAEKLRRRAAPTQRGDERVPLGTVHDPRAAALEGVAGHAGLFSTSSDLAVYAQMMLQRGALERDGKLVRVLAPRTVELMTSPQRVSSGVRGLGWDMQTGYSSNKGDLLSSSAYGHGGFTGTVMWIDPQLELFFIFLSNRSHPDGKGSVNHLAGQILNRVVSAVIDE